MNFSNLLISMPGGGEWILILLAVILLFGGKKIPELMRGIGQGMREFNDAKKVLKGILKMVWYLKIKIIQISNLHQLLYLIKLSKLNDTYRNT